MARRHAARVLVGRAYRDQSTFHYASRCKMVLDPRDYEESAAGLDWLMQNFATPMEHVIRQHPEQYLWLHNRWKHQPKDSKKPARRKSAA